MAGIESLDEGRTSRRMRLLAALIIALGPFCILNGYFCLASPSSVSTCLFLASVCSGPFLPFLTVVFGIMLVASGIGF